MNYVDLHVHSTCSDGLVRPEELPNLAVKVGLEAISITDHDTVAGVERGIEAGREAGIEVVPGVELSTISGETDIHILGYFIDWRNPELLSVLETFRRKRYDRAREMVRRLNKLGLNLSFDTVVEIAGDGALGRPHVAEALVRENLISNSSEAFDRYIGYHGPAYVPKYALSPKDAIRIIISAGGIPVFSHPGTANRDELIPGMVRDGLMGIEAYHPMHPAELRRYYINLAKKHGLVHTGGSDYHGEGRGIGQIGCEMVPISVLEDLRRCLRMRRV